MLVLILVRSFPKLCQGRTAKALALRFAAPLGMLMTVLKPFVWFCKTQRHDGPLHRIGDNSPSVTEQELKVIIETIEGEGCWKNRRADLVQSALEFDEIDAQGGYYPPCGYGSRWTSMTPLRRPSKR